MQVKNLLHQPLELDFGKSAVIRFNAREVKEVPDKYESHPTFQRNAKDLQVIAKPKTAKDKVNTDVQA